MNNMQPRKFGLAYVYALRPIGDGYDVYTNVGIFRNVKGGIVRGYFGAAKGIAWLTEQKLFQPQKTMFYVCSSMALSFLRNKCDLELAEKERRAAEKRRDLQEARRVRQAVLNFIEEEKDGERLLLEAIRERKLLDKAVSQCIV